MLGGGTFNAQNKKLPGTYINFASASRASASLSDRGIVAIPLLMDWGAADEVFEVSNEKFVNNSLKIFVPAIVDKELLNLQKMLDVIIPANLIVNIIINEQIERMRKL